ncbi:MAG: F0F1 ATP synthase subunit B [Buchnera aphidicola (Schlechtendalia peitan)]
MNLNATILGQAISFLLFTFFCMKYIWPSIMLTINNRQKEISDSLSYITSSKKELESYREKMHHEVNIIKKQTREMIDQATQKKDMILKQADIEAKEKKEKILSKVKSEIAIEYQKLKNQLIKDTSQIAINISKKILDNNISNKTVKNIVNDLIHKL